MACNCLSSRYLITGKSITESQQFRMKIPSVFHCISHFTGTGESAKMAAAVVQSSKRLHKSLASCHHKCYSTMGDRNIQFHQLQKASPFDGFGLKVNRYLSSENKDNLPSDAAAQKLFEGEKTKLTILNENTNENKPRFPYIFKYSTRGFTIGSNQVLGSVALAKGCVFSWKVYSHHQITPASLSLFATIQPKLEVLVLGLGDKVSRLSPEVWKFLQEHKIPVEILDTPNACATYNFLTEEGRTTAAGLIPPQNIKVY